MTRFLDDHKKKIGLALLSLLLLIVAGAVTVRVRGFRASSHPSSVEAAVARAVRNFSIPGGESHKKNPYAGDELAIQQGREVYLTRCASCHGTDGRGTTPIGANVYPRVPDLHDQPDAEALRWRHSLHHPERCATLRHAGDAGIGFRFGSRYLGSCLLRPKHASRNAERSSAATDDREQRSLCWFTVLPKVPQRNLRAVEKTPMANVVRDPREHPDAIIPDLNTNDVSKFTVDQVAFVYGSIWKQRYFTKQGDDYYPLPVQWDIGNKKWLKYHVPDRGADWWTAYYPTDNMQRPTSATCDGCHSVSYDIHTKKTDGMECRLRTLPRPRKRARRASDADQHSQSVADGLDCFEPIPASPATRRGSRRTD